MSKKKPFRRTKIDKKDKFNEVGLEKRSARRILAEKERSEVNVKRLSGKIRNAFLGLFALGVGVVGARALVNESKLVVEGSQSASGSNSGDMKNVGFQPENFKVENGVVLKSKVGLEGSKTVIYIPDLHYREESNLELRNRGRDTQMDIVKIVQEILKQYGEIGLVLESWTDFGTNTYKRNLEEEMLWGFSQEDEGIKEQKISPMIFNGRGNVQAGSILAATYSKKILAIPSQDEKQEEEWLRKRLVIDGFDRAIESGLTCDFFVEMGKSVTVKKNIDEVLKGKTGKDEVSCFCTADILNERFFQEFIITRRIGAASSEAYRAANSEKRLTVVISGGMHFSTFDKKMQKEDVNYFVVSPRANLKDNKEIVIEGRVMEDVLSVPFCKDWAKTNGIIVENAYKKFYGYALKAVENVNKK